VAVLHALLILVALVALLGFPCLGMLVVGADFLADSIGRTCRRNWRRWRARRLESRLGRRAGLDRDPATPTTPAGPPIEQVAADLRRLGRQRTGVATRSGVWFAAVQRAYDDRLCLACRELEICEHMAQLTGVDLEIERVRVEGMLQAAGIRLVGVDADHR